MLDGFAHQGILEGSLHILDLAKEAINKALTSLPQYKVVFMRFSDFFCVMLLVTL